MPTGDFGHIGLVVQLLMKLRPQSVLDVGVGYGKYGMLAREYVDYAHFQKRTILIDGIEAFPAYIQDGQRFYYDHVFLGEAKDVLPTLARYDVILLLDVLEHFDKAEGEAVLRMCQSKGSFIIVATPEDIGDQGAVYGNEFERHRFQWRPEHLRPFAPAFFKTPNTLFALIGEGNEQVAHEIKRLNRRARLRTNFPIAYSIYKKVIG